MGNMQSIAFISEPPVIEISGGVARIQYRTGEKRYSRAMSVKVLKLTINRAQRALDRYATGEENIIEDD